MEFRKVTPEEKLYVTRVQSVAFSFIPDENAMREQITKGEMKCDDTYAAIDENGVVVAGMEAIPFEIYFDGNKVKMTGIGGVASAPEHRRGGNIRGIFRKVFDDMRDEGVVFSHLYPFSYDYYRLYGYEYSGYAIKYSIHPSAARKFKSAGTIGEYIKTDDENPIITELKAVYDCFASRHNSMLTANAHRWNASVNIPLFGENKLFYWKNDKGEIKSWARFNKKGDSVNIDEIYWCDSEAMIGILRFFGQFEGAAEKLVIKSGPEFNPELLWPNIYSIGNERNWIGMNRVVDAKKALELMKRPEKEAQFNIKINDEFAPWNQNTYNVQIGPDGCQVKEVTNSPDIEISEKSLLQLLFGMYDLRTLSVKPDVQINARYDKFKGVFPLKQIFIGDYF